MKFQKCILPQEWEFLSCRDSFWRFREGKSKILQGIMWVASQDRSRLIAQGRGFRPRGGRDWAPFMHPAPRLALLIVSTTALASGSGGGSAAGCCPIMTDVHSFNSQLQQLRGSGGVLQDGVALLRRMDAEGVSPNSVTYCGQMGI